MDIEIIANDPVFSALIWVLCPFLPDSPRLLIRKGKYDEAYEVLAALEGHGATPSSPSVKTQFDIIKDVLDREHVNSYSWWELVRGKGPSGVLRRMILGAWMQAMNQISGINVTSYYMTYVFIHALGIDTLRYILLPSLSPSSITMNENKDLRNETQLTHPQSTHPRGRRLSRLPPLLHPRILRHRALRPPSRNDDLRRRVLHLLDNHHHRARPHRLRPRRLLPIRRRRRDLLLRLLRLLRHGRPRRAVALPDGDQCPRAADEGGESGDGDELDHELYGG